MRTSCATCCLLRVGNEIETRRLASGRFWRSPSRPRPGKKIAKSAGVQGCHERLCGSSFDVQIWSGYGYVMSLETI